jgi:hypothetical protein
MTRLGKPPRGRVSLDNIKAGLEPVEAKQGKDDKDRAEEEALTVARHRAETESITQAKRAVNERGSNRERIRKMAHLCTGGGS